MSRSRARQRIESNPFYVLELEPSCSRIDAERQGQKLLGMLELGIEAAASYRTPLGTSQRTPELVREALAELRDPKKRLACELWFVGHERLRTAERSDASEDDTLPWYGATRDHHWRVE